MTPRFGEVITAMVTPFGRDGALDVKGARSLAAHLADHGSEGLVVCGTTGESPTLSHEEKLTLFENVVEEVGDRCKVIAGTGTYDTEETKALTRAAADRGVDACLVVTPYYSKPPQSSLLQHFRAVADDSPVDVIIYDIPGRTGRRVERATMVQLAAHERIVAVKDAVGDAAETALLRADLDAAGAKDFESKTHGPRRERRTSRSTRATTSCCCRISRPAPSGSFPSARTLWEIASRTSSGPGTPTRTRHAASTSSSFLCSRWSWE